ncbi:HNH endonuclease signature motif containing protein [Specibacter cremeus]|uniref:HNH endonuclease signature motif containing protein n=1 Tax=Specibacter cremeus TaxID=1629051 RepID=UPI0013DDE12C|nr:HNH endonuclease signature motif containing protein [Specibacter cremeus]
MDTEQLAPDHAGARASRGSTGGHVRRLLDLAYSASRTADSHDLGPDGLHLDRLPDPDLVTLARNVEAVAAALAAVQVQLAAALAERAGAGRYDGAGSPTPAVFVAHTLRLSGPETGRRLKVAAAVLEQTDPLTGAAHPAPHPVLAEAFLSGRLSLEAAGLVAEYARRAAALVGTGPDGVSAEQADRVEAVLTDLADHHPPESVRACAIRALAHLDPDGEQPTEDELRAKEGLHFGRPRHGLVSIRGHLTVADFELFLATTGTGTNPHPTRDVNPASDEDTDGDGTAATGSSAGHDVPEPGPDAPSASERFFADQCGLFDAVQPGSGQAAAHPALRDERTRAQKLLHRLLDCLRLAAATDTLPDNGGLRPQLHVTVDLEDLRKGLGTAGVPFSGFIPVTGIRQAACDADIIPIVMGSTGAVLDVGRRQRLVTANIRRALIARDGGCAFPDCDRPPQWTEAHHVVPWSEGGPTSVANCCLVCGYHHHLLHRTDWTVQMINGIPWFTAPLAKDARQHRHRNLYRHPPDI